MKMMKNQKINLKTKLSKWLKIIKNQRRLKIRILFKNKIKIKIFNNLFNKLKILTWRNDFFIKNLNII